LSGCTRCTYNLTTSTRNQLNVVNLSTQGHIAQGQSIAHFKRSIWASGNDGTYSQIGRVKDITLLTILVKKQCNPGITVGIILNRNDFGGDVALVAAEIDDAIEPLVATAPVTGSNYPTIIATLDPVDRNNQGLLRL
jgi:hypothetical protein